MDAGNARKQATSKRPSIGQLSGFFPIQLFLLQFRHNPVIIGIFAILFGYVLHALGRGLGIPLLFHDPEYLGSVSFAAYFICGLAFGGLFMAYQISNYICHSYRFPFLATLSRPFLKFTLNNTLLPGLYLLCFVAANFVFQLHNKVPWWECLFMQAGFLAGALIFISLSLGYFFTFSKDIFRLLGVDILKKKPRSHRKAFKPNPSYFDTKTYVGLDGSVHLARSVIHYEPEELQKVFAQNHFVAGIFSFATLITIFLLGNFRDTHILVFPAAASIYLLCTIIIMISGAISAWFGRWAWLASIALFAMLSFLSGYDLLGKRSQVFGLDYDFSIPVSAAALQQNKPDITQDSLVCIDVLSQWKAKAAKPGKPKIILLNASGGGLKAALWTYAILAQLNDRHPQRFYPMLHLIAGSSGGLMGAAFFRAIMQAQADNPQINPSDEVYLNAISADILNRVAFTIATHDLAYRWKHIEINGKKYPRDRSYEFERQFNLNTFGLLDKPLSAFAHWEKAASMPRLIVTPSLLNSSRRLVISPLPTPFLCSNLKLLENDFEFSHLFQSLGADQVSLTTALRLNATFPYILPTVSLPTSPIYDAIDAGLSDNYGKQTSLAYLYYFKDWLKENVSGILVINVNSLPAEKHEQSSRNDFFSILSGPIGSVYNNLFSLQRKSQWQMERMISQEIGLPWHSFDFDLYQYESLFEPITMSFHLTQAEKMKIKEALLHPKNQESFMRLGQFMQGQNQ